MKLSITSSIEENLQAMVDYDCKIEALREEKRILNRRLKTHDKNRKSKRKAVSVSRKRNR